MAATATASARFGLEDFGLPLELEEVLLESISREYMHEAITNPLRLALMKELYDFFHVENNILANLPDQIEIIHAPHGLVPWNQFLNLPLQPITLNQFMGGRYVNG